MLPCSFLLVGFNAKDNAARLFTHFGPGSPYDRSESKHYRKGQVDKSIYPIKGKWQNFLLRRFVECHSREAGSVEGCIEDDSDVSADNVVRNIPLVALLAGKGFLEPLKQSVLQLQNSDMMLAVVMAACRVIERYILNASCLPVEGEMESNVHPVEEVMRSLRQKGRDCPGALDTAMAGLISEVLKCKGLSIEDASSIFGVS